MNVRGSFVRALQVVLLAAAASIMLGQAAGEPVAGSTVGETTAYEGPPGAYYSIAWPYLCWIPEVEVRVDGPNASHGYRQEAQSLQVCNDAITPVGLDREGEGHVEPAQTPRVELASIQEGSEDEEVLGESPAVKEGRRVSGPLWRDTVGIAGSDPLAPLDVQALLDDEPTAVGPRPTFNGEVVFVQRSSQTTGEPLSPAPALPLPIRASSSSPGAADAGASSAAGPSAPSQVGAATGFEAISAEHAIVGAVVAFAAFALYQRFSPASSFDHERRAAIHSALAQWPEGATAGDVARRLGMNRKTVDYHLTYLARLSKVRTSVDETGARRYSLGPLPERKPLVERVLGVVREKPGLSILELAETLGVSRSAADRHAKALVIQGALESRLVEGERRLFASASA